MAVNSYLNHSIPVKGAIALGKNRKSVDDDDERGNLCWSPFSCSTPLHLALLALASLALALLALNPLAFTPLHSALPAHPCKLKWQNAS